MVARYDSSPKVEFQNNGRYIKLLADFSFYDPAELQWAVPAGAVVDGASIPKVFWSIMGGPLDGPYRDASIIHDWYCDRRTRTWQATHRMFYDAMIVSKVPHAKAKIMYFAVRWGGPRWEERVSVNNQLAGGAGARFNFVQSLAPSITTKKVTLRSPGAGFDEAEQLRLFSEKAAQIEDSDLAIEAIDDLADGLKARRKRAPRKSAAD